MPKPTQRIVLQVSVEEYTRIKTLADQRGTTISQLLRDGINALGGTRS